MLSSARRAADEATAMTVDWGRAAGPDMGSFPAEITIKAYVHTDT